MVELYIKLMLSLYCDPKNSTTLTLYLYFNSNKTNTNSDIKHLEVFNTRRIHELTMTLEFD